MKLHNFYFFFINKIFSDNSDLNSQNNLNKNILKFFYLKKNYKIFNNFLKVINFIYIENLKNLKENKIIIKNKENILFFLFNNKIYNINYLDIVIDNKFLNFNFKNYYFSFNFINFFNIKKIIFILKLKFFIKKCQL
jgi:hypothetical protein